MLLPATPLRLVPYPICRRQFMMGMVMALELVVLMPSPPLPCRDRSMDDLRERATLLWVLEMLPLPSHLFFSPGTGPLRLAGENTQSKIDGSMPSKLVRLCFLM